MASKSSLSSSAMASAASASSQSNKKRKEGSQTHQVTHIHTFHQPSPGEGYYERPPLDPLSLAGTVSGDATRPLGTLPFCSTTQDTATTAENAIRRVPSSLTVSAFCAMVEWFRVKTDALLEKNETLRVLSVANDAPEYDAMVLRILASKFKHVEYTIVGVNSDQYQPLLKDETLSKHVKLIDEPFMEWIEENTEAKASDSAATILSSSVRNKFDVIHCAVWRKQFKRDITSALDNFLELLKPGGCLLAFTFSKAGIFALRDRLWCQIGPPPESSRDNGSSEECEYPWVGLRPEMYVHNWLSEQLRKSEHANEHSNESGGASGVTSTGTDGVPSVQALCAGHRNQLVAWRERVDSHIDITDCVTDSLDGAAEAKLNEIIAHDINTIKERDSEILEDVIVELCDMSLAGNGIDEPAIVYAPLDVYMVRPPDSNSETFSRSAISDLVSVDDSEALPFFPVDVFSMASASAPSPVDNVVMLSSWLKDHPSVVNSPHSNTLLCPLKGSWGSFRGTGTAHASARGVIHSEIRAELDRRYREGEEINSNLPLVRAARVELDPPSSRLALCRDDWWPHGKYGGFFNVGLQNWLDLRYTWTARTSEMKPVEQKPVPDLDELAGELSQLRKTYELPVPMRLDDLVDLYVDIWEAQDGM